MKRLLILLSAFSLITFGSCSKDDGTQQAKPVIKKEDPKTEEKADENSSSNTAKNYVFLCFGQSNMEGNAPIQEKDNTVDPRFKSYVCFAGNYDGKDYKVGDVRPATPPLCRAGQAGGIGVTDYFGRTMVEKLPKESTVSVVLVAIGGTGIDGFHNEKCQAYVDQIDADWLKNYYKLYDNKPYQRLLDVAKIAQKDGEIAGFIFHQGETDAYSPEWNEKLKYIYEWYIKELGLDAKKVPLLAGQVTANNNECINNIPKYIKNSYVISSEGCDNAGIAADGFDNKVHFSHQGYEDMGKRYAEQMLKIMGIK